MKLKVNDTVLVTTGKDKGKSGVIVRLYPKLHKVVVEGLNKYVKHIKPMSGKSGDRVLVERALPVANVAILNENKQPDRVGYSAAKDGSRIRIFKKTGTAVPENQTKKK